MVKTIIQNFAAQRYAHVGSLNTECIETHPTTPGGYPSTREQDPKSTEFEVHAHPHNLEMLVVL